MYLGAERPQKVQMTHILLTSVAASWVEATNARKKRASFMIGIQMIWGTDRWERVRGQCKNETVVSCWTDIKKEPGRLSPSLLSAISQQQSAALCAGSLLAGRYSDFVQLTSPNKMRSEPLHLNHDNNRFRPTSSY